MNDFLMRRALDDISLDSQIHGSLLSGEALVPMMKKISRYVEEMKKVQRIAPDRLVVEVFLGMIFSQEQGLTYDSAAVRRLLSDVLLVEILSSRFRTLGYKISFRADEKHPGLQVLVLNKEMEAEITIDYDFLFSIDMHRLMEACRQISSMDKPPFQLYRNGEGCVFESHEKLFDFVVEKGKKDISFQRYKGLGEMNPEQLWETTMNPQKRTLLRVSVDDEIKTDEIFTILMGEEVEPRRRFIEENALHVSNLDI